MAENRHKNSQRADHLRRHRFRPGETGNPGGRPRGTTQFAELIANETRHGAELVEYALRVLRSRSRKAPKTWAVEYLTERMLSKAPQHIDLGGKVEGDGHHSDVKEVLWSRIAAIMEVVAAEGMESRKLPAGLTEAWRKGGNLSANKASGSSK